MSSFSETFKELDALVEENRKMHEAVRQRVWALEKKEKRLNDDLNPAGEGGGDTGGARSPRGGKDGKSGAGKDGASPGAAASSGGSPHGDGSARREESDASRLKIFEDVFGSIMTSTNLNNLEDVVQFSNHMTPCTALHPR